MQVDIEEADHEHGVTRCGFQRPVVLKVSQVTSKKCNEARSDELCGSGRKFVLSINWKAKYSCIKYKCCHYITREDSYAAFIIEDFSNSRSLYAYEH